MRSVRKEGSQYFLKTLQYTSLAREIETTIHGLLMHIYMLNTRVAILSGYTGENEVKGKTAVELHTIKDTRYIMAELQPDLTMTSFLYPDEPTGKYYKKLKMLLKNSGLYNNPQDVTADLINFLDRFIIKFNLNKTLEEYLDEQENSVPISDEYENALIQDEKHIETMDLWRKKYGNGIFSGNLKLEVADISTDLNVLYEKNINYLKYHHPHLFDTKTPPPNSCPPDLVRIPNSPLNRFIPIKGTLSINPTNCINFEGDNLATLLKSEDEVNRIFEKLYRLPPLLTDPIIKEAKCENTIEEKPNSSCRSNPNNDNIIVKTSCA